MKVSFKISILLFVIGITAGFIVSLFTNGNEKENEPATDISASLNSDLYRIAVGEITGR